MCCLYTFFVDRSFEMGATGRETANFVGGVAKVTGTYTGGLVGWIDPKRLQIPKTGDSSVLGLWGGSPSVHLLPDALR